MIIALAGQAWLEKLDASRANVLSGAARLDGSRLCDVAHREARLALAALPMPVDAATHLRAAHAAARPYLQRLLAHDPAAEVVASLPGYTYTPRKILRRVLDHALDHLNQIDQWLDWQLAGIFPTPTDGWVGSAVTLDEDRAPLNAAELAAWLWRIDLAVEMVARRASRLAEDQLDWMPPDGGWSLRRILRHLAATELFYSIWLDEPLPDQPVARYTEANRRMRARLAEALVHSEWANVMLFDSDALPTTPKHIAQEALEAEQALLVGA
jgi:hypothetical protein